MKTLTFIINCFILLGLLGCSDDDKNSEYLYLSNETFFIFPNYDSAIKSGRSEYLFFIEDEQQSKILLVYLIRSGFMSGKVINVPDDINESEIPTEGLEISLSGKVKQSDKSYSIIPEVQPIELNVTSFALK